MTNEIMIIDGKAIAQSIFDNLSGRITAIKEKGITPHLVIILVGNDPASESYVRQKILKGEAIGVKVTVTRLPASVTQQELLKLIDDSNHLRSIHGLIVQQPLPSQIDIPTITSAVTPAKDVDGFHNDSPFDPPLANAVIKILGEVDKDFLSKNIVVIGKGETGGGPVISKLKTMNVAPKIIDSKTPDPKSILQKADIIISAVGKPNIVNVDDIKKGTVIIAVGMFKGEDGKMRGDYNEEEIADIASFYTPVPGGVGPVNVAMLLENVVTAAEKSIN